MAPGPLCSCCGPRGCCAAAAATARKDGPPGKWSPTVAVLPAFLGPFRRRAHSAPTLCQSWATHRVEEELLFPSLGHGCRSCNLDSWNLQFLADAWLKGCPVSLSPTEPFLEVENFLHRCRVQWDWHRKEMQAAAAGKQRFRIRYHEAALAALPPLRGSENRPALSNQTSTMHLESLGRAWNPWISDARELLFQLPATCF